MQWASSIARQSSLAASSRPSVRGISSVSGATYSSLTSPLRTRAMFSWYSWGDSVLLRNSAATPRALSCSTWSFIRAISGETTTVRPGKIKAGSW